MDKQEGVKKLALRFLKEAGLLSAFHEYIANNKDCDIFERCNLNTWYKDVYHYDEVFGRLNFTRFLRREKNIHIRDASFSDVYRAWLKEIYGIECPLTSTLVRRPPYFVSNTKCTVNTENIFYKLQS